MMYRNIKAFIFVLLIGIQIAGCRSPKIEVPSSVTNGYVAGDYNIYSKAAKENGKKYDKLYVVGKFSGDPFENGDYLVSYFVDESNRKYLLRLDSKKTDLKEEYFQLKNKQICACGIYAGSLKDDPMPVIFTNSIYDIKNKKTIVSQYYGEYNGDFDETGKIVSTDYDKDDNTIIDFHSIQIQIPYNYVEDNLSDELGYYIIDENNSFFINYVKQDLDKILSDYQKRYDLFKKVKDPLAISSMYEAMFKSNCKFNISNIKDDTYKRMVSYDFDGDFKNIACEGRGTIIFKNDGVYIITLISGIDSKFNRTQDYYEIIKSIKELSPARQPKSTGINKKTSVKKEESSQQKNNQDIKNSETNKETENNVENETIKREKQNGWIAEEGTWYYYKNGKKERSKFIEDYYVDEDGRMLSNTTKEIKGKNYRFDQDGKYTIVEDLELVGGIAGTSTRYDGYFATYISGIVRNNTNKKYSYLQITFDLLDKEGNKVGTAFANENNIGPGETWKFEAIALEDFSRYRLDEITGW